MSSNLVEFAIMDAIESHDTSVTSLLCSSLAGDSGTTGYHFLTSVIKTLIGKEAQSIPHVPGFCSPPPLSAEVELCEQKLLVHVVTHARVADFTHR